MFDGHDINSEKQVLSKQAAFCFPPQVFSGSPMKHAGTLDYTSAAVDRSPGPDGRVVMIGINITGKGRDRNGG